MSLKIYSLNLSELSSLEKDSLYHLYEESYRSSRFPIASFHSMESFFQSPQAQFMLLKEEGEIIGFLEFAQLEENFFEIWNVAISVKFWGRGFGDELMKYFHTEVLPKSSTASLEVHEKNEAAISLYSRNHWEIMRRRKNYYPGGYAALVFELRKESNS